MSLAEVTYYSYYYYHYYYYHYLLSSTQDLLDSALKLTSTRPRPHSSCNGDDFIESEVTAVFDVLLLLLLVVIIIIVVVVVVVGAYDNGQQLRGWPESEWSS